MNVRNARAAAGGTRRRRLRGIYPHSTFPPVRIVIIEDHVMFREVLRKICEVDLKHKVVGEAADGEEAVRVVASLKPDMILLDLHLPKMNGFDVLERIRETRPELAVLVLSSHCDDYTVYRAERANVNGFVDKNSNSLQALKQAIKEVAGGGRAYSDAFKTLQTARHRDPAAFDKLLGDREREVLALVGRALRDHEIGEKLGISQQTVATHRKNIIRKLGLENGGAMMRYARDHGFTLSVPEDDGGLLP
jgi:DNA-binding NarL/FixJ family response regulator